MFKVSFTAGELYENLTIREQTEFIKQFDKRKYIQIYPTAYKEYYPLTPIQRSIFNLSLYADNDTSFNMPMIYTIEGDLKIELLRKVMETIANRHDAFKTSFKVVEQEPVQMIRRDIKFHINYTEINGEITEKLIKEFILPIDVSVAPLFRMHVIKYGIRKFALILDTHHIVSDGISSSVLIKEIQEGILTHLK